MGIMKLHGVNILKIMDSPVFELEKFFMRVPGDIIDGTDGADIPSCWSENTTAQAWRHTHSRKLCLFEP